MHHHLIKTPIKNDNIIFPEAILEVFLFVFFGPTLIIIESWRVRCGAS